MNPAFKKARDGADTAKGYIYTMFRGADPGAGWTMTDPILSDPPTLGSCVPNIRRLVVPGDHVFVISGRTPGLRQYVVGGFEVARKITQLAALAEFPQYQQAVSQGGALTGNIIIDDGGNQLPSDYHSNFERRLDNYIVGRKPLALVKEHHIALAREMSQPFLAELFNREGPTVFDIVGRWRRLTAMQIRAIRTWLEGIGRC